MHRDRLFRPDAVLARVAARQHGALTRQQAVEAGLSDRQVDLRIEAGRFVPIRRGVLVIAGAPPTWEQAAMAAVLSAPVGSMASHATASRLWGFDPCPPDTGFHILSPGSARVRAPGAIGHRSQLIVPADVSQRAGIPVTSPARTLVDVCGTLGADATGRALDELLRRRIVTLDLVRAAASRLAGPGRRKIRPMAVALARRVEGYDLSDSDLEVMALTLIRRAGLPLPVQQHRVVVRGRTYYLDLAYPQHRVAIELDGWEWHGKRRSGFDRTHRRLAALVAAGWTVLPFTSETIDEMVAHLIDVLPSPDSGHVATSPVAR